MRSHVWECVHSYDIMIACKLLREVSWQAVFVPSVTSSVINTHDLCCVQCVLHGDVVAGAGGTRTIT